MYQSVSTCISLEEANSERLAVLVEKVAGIEKTSRRVGASMNDDDTFSEPGLSLSSLATIKVSQPLSEGTASRLSWQVTPAESRKCNSWCSCCCHSRKTFVMPRLLTSVLGHVVLEYTGNRSKCNEQSCRRSKATSFNLSYNLPWYVSTKYLSIAMAYTPLYGARVTLRMPRVMDWEHLLWMYANEGNIIAVQKLFSSAKASPHDVNLMGRTALNYAIRHPRLYRFLIENGGDAELADIHGEKPGELMGERLLCAELEEEDAYAIRKMLDETDFMETRQFTTIHKIVLGILKRSLRDELKMSTALVNSTDSMGRTPLAWATIRDDLQTVATLLAFDADPNVCDNSGQSCLHFIRSPEVCFTLLQGKADVHITSKTFGASCLQAVCKRLNYPEVIDLLHDAGANINHRDADGETPLLNAIFKKSTRTARRLIELGADVNAANYSSRESALHFAVSFDHHEILPVLLERGADYTTINCHGRSLAHMAARWGGAKTLTTLAISNLAGLDLSVRDVRGKTAADYMIERDFFTDSETETREAFGILQQSILNREVAAHQCSSASGCVTAESGIPLPGAYPT